MKKINVLLPTKLLFFSPSVPASVKNVFQMRSQRLSLFSIYVNLGLINWHRKGELNLWRRALVSLDLSACQRNKTAPRPSNPFRKTFKDMGSINQNDSRLWSFIKGVSSHRVVSVGLESYLNRIIQIHTQLGVRLDKMCIKEPSVFIVTDNTRNIQKMSHDQPRRPGPTRCNL